MIVEAIAKGNLMSTTIRQTELKHLQEAALRRLAAAALHHRETRKAQYRRARERSIEAGLIRIWAWVPEGMVESIKSLMADMIAQLDTGHPPRFTLTDAHEEGAVKGGDNHADDTPGVGDPGMPEKEDAEEGQEENGRESAGAASAARKRMRNHRAVARKREAGLKRIALTIPQLHERVLRAQLALILDHMQAGREVRIPLTGHAKAPAPVPRDPDGPPATAVMRHGTGGAPVDIIPVPAQVVGHDCTANVRNPGGASESPGSRT